MGAADPSLASGQPQHLSRALALTIGGGKRLNRWQALHQPVEALRSISFRSVAIDLAQIGCDQSRSDRLRSISLRWVWMAVWREGHEGDKLLASVPTTILDQWRDVHPFFQPTSGA
jgi:hypothetical protein